MPQSLAKNTIIKSLKIAEDREITGLLKLQISGAITEKSDFPVLDLNKIKELHFDLSDMSYINSAGVRRWILWFWNIEKDQPQIKLFIDKCPHVVAKQIAGVSEFIPASTIILSFFAPYFCDHCSQGFDRLIQNDAKLFTDQKSLEKLLDEEQICSICHKPMELDVSLEQFLKLMTYR